MNSTLTIQRELVRDRRELFRLYVLPISMAVWRGIEVCLYFGPPIPVHITRPHRLIVHTGSFFMCGMTVVDNATLTSRRDAIFDFLGSHL